MTELERVRTKSNVHWNANYICDCLTTAMKEECKQMQKYNIEIGSTVNYFNTCIRMVREMEKYIAE